MVRLIILNRLGKSIVKINLYSGKKNFSDLEVVLSKFKMFPRSLLSRII